MPRDRLRGWGGETLNSAGRHRTRGLVGGGSGDGDQALCPQAVPDDSRRQRAIRPCPNRGFYDALPRRLGETRLTDLIDDRRFAETIYRVALADGIMDRVTYQDPPKTLPNRSGQTVVAQLAHEGLRRRATPSQAKLSRDSNQIARGRICGSESHHPSQAVGSRTRDLSARRSGITRFDIETRKSRRSERSRDTADQSSSQSVHDPAPHASPTPPNEAIVASGIGAEPAAADRAMVRQIAGPKRCHSGHGGRSHVGHRTACSAASA